ncbi:MAG: VWA domain-containing protein [Labilithrix sp.]|nr:VWA domain-containing protein [Labilithrix sp.]
MPADIPAEPYGGAEIVAPDGRSLPFAGAKLRIEAGGGLARIVLEQTFENPFAEALRVTYKLPLPVDGAVSAYAFRVGQRTIRGTIDRKEAARARFEEAIAEGRTAALLEQQKADIFEQEIGNIPPRQSITCEITIDLRLAWRTEGEWELRFPTVIGTRYIGANVTPEDTRASKIQVADGGVRARMKLAMTIDDAITPGRQPESPSHQLRARQDGSIELLDEDGARLDRDIVVRWSVAQQDVGLALQVARPAATLPHARHAYGLLSIVPPAPDARWAAVPRDLIVLLDTSGSMEGPPLEQAKRVVASLIDSLTEKDRLEVVEFSMRPNRYTNGPVAGTKREKEKAVHWVMSRRANGGTEMQAAIVEALRGLRPGAQRQVVLVTDGYVGGEHEIVMHLHESLPDSCRLHVVGVGSGVNRALASSLARAGRGAELLVGLDEDAERLAKSLVDKTRAPILTDLTIGGDALVEHAPEHVPDVFAGAPVVAALKLRPSGGEIVVRGKLARGTWEQRIAVAPCDPGQGSGAVVALYGRERVADLEMCWTIGRDVQSIDREIESVGLVFQIATRRTSWVAIDEDRTVDPGLGSRHEEIPQEIPYGTSLSSMMSLAMPMMPMMAMAEAEEGSVRTLAGSVDALVSLAAPSVMRHRAPEVDADDEPTAVGARAEIGNRPHDLYEALPSLDLASPAEREAEDTAQMQAPVALPSPARGAAPPLAGGGGFGAPPPAPLAGQAAPPPQSSARFEPIPYDPRALMAPKKRRGWLVVLLVLLALFAIGVAVALAWMFLSR